LASVPSSIVGDKAGILISIGISEGLVSGRKQAGVPFGQQEHMVKARLPWEPESAIHETKCAPIWP